MAAQAHDRAGSAEPRVCRRTDLYVGLERITRLEREYLALSVQVSGQARRLFSPRHLLRIVSGPRTRWSHEALCLCLQHRLPVVFLGENENALGTLQPWQARHYPLDLLLVSVLNSPGGRQRLMRWYTSRRHAVAGMYLHREGRKPGHGPAEQVLCELDHQFRVLCVPLRDESLIRRFDLSLDLMASRFLYGGKLERTGLNGSFRGFSLRRSFGRLFRLEARRLLLARELMLPGHAACVPGFVERALRHDLVEYNGRLHATLAELGP